MNSLIKLGFSIEEIQTIMDTNINLKSLPETNISKLISLLEKHHCELNEIKNIISCNPFCFNNDMKEVENIIKYLSKLITPISSLINSNPFILNKSLREIKELKKDDLIDYRI